MPRRNATRCLLIVLGLLAVAGLPAFAQSQPTDEPVALAPLEAEAAGGGFVDREAHNPEPAFDAIAATCSAVSQELMATPLQLASFDPLGSEPLSMEGLTSTEVAVGDAVWRAASSCFSSCTLSFCRAWCMLDNGSPNGFCGPCGHGNPYERRCWCP